MKDLENIPEDERKHFMKCPECANYFDMRDLGQLFQHIAGHPPKGTRIKLKWNSARRVGDPEEFLHDKRKTLVNLN